MNDWTDILNEVVASTADITNDVERIKAILLHENRCGSTALIYKNIIADEWNSMEDELQIEAFWTFINPNPDAPRYEFSRMSFLFEMLLRCEKDEDGAFVNMSAQLSRNNHYLFERCLSIMMDQEIKAIPFLRCDTPLDELINEEFGLPFAPDEITRGMFALWFAVKSMFRRMWAWYSFLVLDNPTDCFTTETGESGTNIVRDLFASMIEANEDELIPTGRTLKDNLDEEDWEDDDFEVDDWR
jgi:hypothetical protein